MPQRYSIEYDPVAAKDLQQIYDYIALDSPRNAASMVEQLLEAIEGLDILPHRYNVPRNTQTVDREVRCMPVSPYLIRYKIDEVKLMVRF